MSLFGSATCERLVTRECCRKMSLPFAIDTLVLKNWLGARPVQYGCVLLHLVMSKVGSLNSSVRLVNTAHLRPVGGMGRPLIARPVQYGCVLVHLVMSKVGSLNSSVRLVNTAHLRPVGGMGRPLRSEERRVGKE